MKPGKQSLNLPPAFVSAQWPAILSLPLPIGSIRCDEVYSKVSHFFIERVAVIGTVADQFLRPILRERGVQRLSHQCHFVGRSASHVNGDRKTISVCDCHDFAPFPAFRRANTIAPFFADENEPSINPSPRSIFPRSSKSLARERSTASSTPSSVHRCIRRWHVWYGGYLSGRSFHGAPVRSTQRIPLSTSRLERQGRPRPSERRGSSGNIGSMISHCLSVKSMAINPRFLKMEKSPTARKTMSSYL